ncbi:UNVERIFIED_CONTAM: spore germination protein KA/spore germination protein [Acetivibrio alkalicellulosi]
MDSRNFFRRKGSASKIKIHLNRNKSDEIEPLSLSLKDNLNKLKTTFEHCEDLVYRKVSSKKSNVDFLLVYFGEMIEKNTLNNNILKYLIHDIDGFSKRKSYEYSKFIKASLPVSNIEEVTDYNSIIGPLLSGDIILFTEDCYCALIIPAKTSDERSIAPSATERTIRGPQDAFVENINKNIHLIRKRIQDPNLAVEFFTLGHSTNTNIALLYIKGIAKNDIINKIRLKISTIDSSSILASAQLEQLIESHKWSLFPQTLATDRPDKLSRSLLEGRAVIIVNGTPFALIAPVTFAMFFNSSDDYFERTIVTSTIRIVRYICFISSIFLPALYLAMTSYHPGMLPTPLALYITGARVGLPFPSLVELVFMQFTTEVLIEASVRLPKAIGQTVGIVGGLVIGQSVVQAGLVNPLIVIVVSLTALATFILPVYTFALSTRILRAIMIIAAATFGLYGIVIAGLFILIHMSSIESFGIRYLEDFSPYSLSKLKDTLIKAPHQYINRAPEYLNEKNNDEV